MKFVQQTDVASKVMIIYTDKQLKHSRPDIPPVQKGKQKWAQTDLAISADQDAINTEEEKAKRYKARTFEIKRITEPRK